MQAGFPLRENCRAGVPACRIVWIGNRERLPYNAIFNDDVCRFDSSPRIVGGRCDLSVFVGNQELSPDNQSERALLKHGHKEKGETEFQKNTSKRCNTLSTIESLFTSQRRHPIVGQAFLPAERKGETEFQEWKHSQTGVWEREGEQATSLCSCSEIRHLSRVADSAKLALLLN